MNSIEYSMVWIEIFQVYNFANNFINWSWLSTRYMEKNYFEFLYNIFKNYQNIVFYKYEILIVN